MIDSTAYGEAIFALAQEEQREQTVLEQLRVVREAVTPDYVTLLDTPAIPQEEKLSLLREAFTGADGLILNFLCILCEKRSFYQLGACVAAYEKAYDAAHNILRAEAVTAVPMEDRQRKALTEKLSAMTGKTVLLTNTTDPSVLGGVTLRYGGVQQDDSLRTRLEQLRRSLKEAVV